MDDSKLEELYNEYLEFTAEAIERCQNGGAVAAIMMTQAMGIYRTILSDEEYDTMASEIWERRNEVKPFKENTIQ